MLIINLVEVCFLGNPAFNNYENTELLETIQIGATMKTKHILFTFAFSFFSFFTSFAQTEKPVQNRVEGKNNINNETKNIDGIQTVGDKIIIKNEHNNSIMQIIEETNAAASILLYDKSNFNGTSIRFFNSGGNLFWGNDQLSVAGNAGGWTDAGTQIYNTTHSDKVGIGTNNPQSPLSVGGLGTSSATISAETTTGWGVYGKATTGRGVFGSANGTGGEGVIAEAHGQNGRAISGYASDASGYAGYFGGNVQINGATKVGSNGTPFLEIREISGTTANSGSSTSYSNGLPSGWTGENTRLLSFEINSDAGLIGLGYQPQTDAVIISVRMVPNTEAFHIYHPALSYYWGKPWRAIVMKMP